MTEKRFVPISVEWTDGFVQDHYNDKDLFSIQEVCDLLNILSEENEELKEQIQCYEGRISKLYESHRIETDRNGYYICNGVSCPVCNSPLEECREIAYMNGEVYKEFDCDECGFTGRLRKGNLYEM